MCIFLFLHRLAAWVPERRAGRKERGILKILNKPCLLNWTHASGFRLLPRFLRLTLYFSKTHLNLGMKKLASDCWGWDDLKTPSSETFFPKVLLIWAFKVTKYYAWWFPLFSWLITPKAKPKHHHILIYKWKSSCLLFHLLKRSLQVWSFSPSKSTHFSWWHISYFHKQHR